MIINSIIVYGKGTAINQKNQTIRINYDIKTHKKGSYEIWSDKNAISAYVTKYFV